MADLKLLFRIDLKRTGKIDQKYDPRFLCFGPNQLMYLYDHEYGDIQVLDYKGKFQFRFGKQGSKKNWFCGMCFGPNNLLYVCDKNNYCIQIFDQDGEFQFQFGSEGSKNGQFFFYGGCGLCFGPNDLLYVCDACNYCIQVFDIHGKFQFKFDSQKEVNRLIFFSSSCNLCFGSNGLLYVCNTIYQNIQVFNMKGEFQFEFDLYQIEPGRYYYPYFLCAGPNNLLYIYNYIDVHTQVFDLKGNFQFYFSTSPMSEKNINNIDTRLGSHFLCFNDNMIYIIYPNGCHFIDVFQYTKTRVLQQILSNNITSLYCQCQERNRRKLIQNKNTHLNRNVSYILVVLMIIIMFNILF